MFFVCGVFLLGVATGDFLAARSRRHWSQIHLPADVADRLRAWSESRVELGHAICLEFVRSSEEPVAWPDDNTTDELLAFARAGDRVGFDALAACLMPPDRVEECWTGARSRLGVVLPVDATNPESEAS